MHEYKSSCLKCFRMNGLDIMLDANRIRFFLWHQFAHKVSISELIISCDKSCCSLILFKFICNASALYLSLKVHIHSCKSTRKSLDTLFCLYEMLRLHVLASLNFCFQISVATKDFQRAAHSSSRWKATFHKPPLFLHGWEMTAFVCRGTVKFLWKEFLHVFWASFPPWPLKRAGGGFLWYCE